MGRFLTYVWNLIAAVLLFAGGLVENIICVVLGVVLVSYWLASVSQGEPAIFSGAVLGVAGLLTALSLIKMFIAIENNKSGKTGKTTTPDADPL